MGAGSFIPSKIFASGTPKALDHLLCRRGRSETFHRCHVAHYRPRLRRRAPSGCGVIMRGELGLVNSFEGRAQHGHTATKWATSRGS
jgi:hypothetical protein